MAASSAPSGAFSGAGKKQSMQLPERLRVGKPMAKANVGMEPPCVAKLAARALPINEALDGFDAFRLGCHQRDADMMGAGIARLGLPAQEGPRQYADVQVSKEGACELPVVLLRRNPEVEAAFRLADVEDGVQQRRGGLELGPVQGSVAAHMVFIAPRRGARLLHMKRQGGTLVGAVLVVARQRLGVAGHESGAQPRQTGALAQGVEDDATGVAGVAQGVAFTQQASGRMALVEVNLRIAFVGGDHEVETVGLFDQPALSGGGHYLAGGVAWRAQVEDFGARPQGIRHRFEVRLVAVGAVGVEVVGHGTAQNRRAFVDLVERIGQHHHWIGLGAHRRLGEGEQRFPGAGHRQNAPLGIQFGAEAALQPGTDGLAQFRDPASGGVGAQTLGQALAIGQKLNHGGGRLVLGLADGQAHMRSVRGGRDAVQQCREALEGIVVQLAQAWVHVGRLSRAWRRVFSNW